MAAPPPEPLHNWAGNITYSTTSVEMPATMDEVCEAVKTATKLRAVGSRHSFNTIADSTVELFSVKQIKDIAIDTKVPIGDAVVRVTIDEIEWIGLEHPSQA